jgi:exodeoxyribonuclease VII large subunit
MSQLLDSPSLDLPLPGSNLPEFSVSEISRQLKQTVEERFGHVRVRAEIGDCKHHSNGHVYLTLRDESNVLAAVIWKGTTSRLGVRPEVGMDVVCTGRLTIFAGQSKYQLVIEQMALAGVGALLKLIEERKQRLAAEGLFAPERKRPLPFLPRRLGVITSPTGAVIRDILHRVTERFPCHVMIWPVAVQGAGAAAQVAAAIAGFNALPPEHPLRPDVLIVARGGGSLEDLMAFNEEVVLRAAAMGTIPLLSAVGHETDTTLLDFVADRRAPTPTAAAEMAVPVRAALLVQTATLGARLVQSWQRSGQNRQQHLALLARPLAEPQRLLEPLWQRLDDRSARLTNATRQIVTVRDARLHILAGRLPHPRDWLKIATQRVHTEARGLQAALRQTKQRLHDAEQRLPELAARMDRAYQQRLEHRARQLQSLGQLLLSLSPQGVLERGYALIRTPDGGILSTAAAVQAATQITLLLQDGAVAAQVIPPAAKPRQGRLI